MLFLSHNDNIFDYKLPFAWPGPRSMKVMIASIEAVVNPCIRHGDSNPKLYIFIVLLLVPLEVIDRFRCLIKQNP